MTATKPSRSDHLRPQPEGRRWPTEEWPAGPPDAAVDTVRPNELVRSGFGPGTDPSLERNLALCVVHRGRLVAEACWPDTDADTTLISWSMGKSITHAMVGLLAGDGRLDVTAAAPVPRWADDERSAITLQALLTMTSGLRFVEDYVDEQVSDVIEMLFGSGSDDVAAFAESRPMAHPGGSHFNYSSGTTNIVSAICGRAITGSPSTHHDHVVGAIISCFPESD